MIDKANDNKSNANIDDDTNTNKTEALNASPISWNCQEYIVSSLLSQKKLKNTKIFDQFKSILIKQVNVDVTRHYSLTKESIYCFKLYMITQKIPIIPFYDQFQLDLINYAMAYYNKNKHCIKSPSLLCALMSLNQMYKYRTCANRCVENESEIMQISKQIKQIILRKDIKKTQNNNNIVIDNDKEFFEY